LQVVYGISFDAIMHKLHDMGIINDSKYKTYCIRKNHDDAWKQFVEATLYKEDFSTKFDTMVYAAAAKDLISTSKAANLLHSSVSTVRKRLSVI
jgi:Zn-dependent peptidase ImmA (M78 family)